MAHSGNKKIIFFIGIVLLFSMASCAAIKETPLATPQILATNAPSLTPTRDIKPGEPPGAELEFSDVSSREFWQDKSVLGGDVYVQNFFERPFTTEMVYLPDVDILKAAISVDPEFFYFTITLSDINPVSGGLEGSYGIELDMDLDGRGDYSIWALNPKSDSWTMDGVTILQDVNKDVGGEDPALGETGWSGDGYETAISNNKPNAAWVRVLLSGPVKVQIGVYRKLLGEPTYFLWGVYADNGLKDPGRFDYDDFITFKDAGSGFAESSYYPLKEVNSSDNTCRQPYGFTLEYKIPNACFATAPQATQAALDCGSFLPPNCPPGCVAQFGGNQTTCVPGP